MMISVKWIELYLEMIMAVKNKDQQEIRVMENNLFKKRIII